MTGEKNRRRNGLIALAGVALAAVAIWSFGFSMGPRISRSDWPRQFQSNGERLYFTGVNVGGQPIRAIGGDRHMPMMGGGACVACLGTDRQGGRLRPSFWMVAPAITAEALTGAHGDTDEHAHSAYTRESLAAALTRGLRPDGSEIGPGMPRWAMSPEDLSDLVAYILPGDSG
ncbi:c-type cytochrome [Falsihalocynthiibacter arcticus]|uniref:c-type cytochrome n=1 Tax=Falsihalocynthiibacter arcticus TaxID=1579316 RepID=UPI0030012AEF